MFTLRKPTEADVRELLARQPGQPWTYAWPEITREVPQPRPGWQIDRHRVLLGHGAATFAAACDAIRGWKMFPRQMCQVFWPTTRQEPGEVVAVLYFARPFAIWMLFPARVVYRICSPTLRVGHASDLASGRDGFLPSAAGSQSWAHTECGPTYGFAYGTLPDHPERGEERFLVEWNEADDSVWYDLMAISRPGHWLARAGYPYARYEQAKFRRLSGLAMQEAVGQRPQAA
jgi:uncharacterized protein (UPF0548 family)